MRQSIQATESEEAAHGPASEDILLRLAARQVDARPRLHRCARGRVRPSRPEREPCGDRRRYGLSPRPLPVLPRQAARCVHAAEGHARRPVRKVEGRRFPGDDAVRAGQQEQERRAQPARPPCLLPDHAQAEVPAAAGDDHQPVREGHPGRGRQAGPAVPALGKDPSSRPHPASGEGARPLPVLPRQTAAEAAAATGSCSSTSSASRARPRCVSSASAPRCARTPHR